MLGFLITTSIRLFFFHPSILFTPLDYTKSLAQGEVFDKLKRACKKLPFLKMHPHQKFKSKSLLVLTLTFKKSRRRSRLENLLRNFIVSNFLNSEFFYSPFSKYVCIGPHRPFLLSAAPLNPACSDNTQLLLRFSVIFCWNI